MADSSGGPIRVGPATLLVSIPPTGVIHVNQICDGCDTVGREDHQPPGETERGLHYLGGWLGAAGLACLMVAVARYRRSRWPLKQWLGGRAPSALVAGSTASYQQQGCVLESFPSGGTRFELPGPTVGRRGRGLQAVDSSEVPRIELCLSDALFREQPAGPPRLHGPGWVNGLRVDPSVSTPLQEGDVVKLGGGPAFQLHLFGTPFLLIRYHAEGASHIRLWTPPVAGKWTIAGWVGTALAGATGAILVQLDLAARWPAGLIFLCLWSLGMITTSWWDSQWEARSYGLRVEGEAAQSRQASVAGLSYTPSDGGGFVLSDSFGLKLEQVAAPSRWVSADQRVLHEAFRLEAEWIGRQAGLRPLSE